MTTTTATDTTCANTWHDRAISAGLICECGAVAPTEMEAPKRSSLLRSVLLATAARTAVAGLITTAALLSSHHTVTLSAYSAPDQPGCVAAPYAGPGTDQGYYCDQYAVDTRSSSDPVADCLIGEGYHGRPDDASETIYATSDAIEGCAAGGDLDQVVAVVVDDGAPADLIACWIASGATHDPIDGPGTLTASRLVIDSCNPLGWVGA